MSGLSAAMRRLLRRLPGTGSPSLPLLVAQVFNLCVFPVRIGLAASSLACAIPERGSSRIGGTRRSREWQEVKTLVLWM